MRVVALDSYTWPTDPFSLALVVESVETLASRIGAQVKEWSEDGLGPVRGICVRLPSGRVVLIQEYTYAIQHGMHSGPELAVDAADVATLGVDALLQEVLEVLEIPPGAVQWRQASSAAAIAAERAAAAIRWRASKK